MKIQPNGEVERPYTVLSLQATPPNLVFKADNLSLPFTMLPVGSFEGKVFKPISNITIHWV